MKIAVLITVHNRREKTLSALRSLMAQWPDQHAVRVVLVDDGSTDGTAEAVTDEFPEVHVVPANGDLFWCKGMALAWDTAAELDEFDGFLWLNDDVILDEHAIAGMLAVAADPRHRPTPAILVGATRDPDSGQTTYGGLRLASRWHPGKHERIEPNGAIQPIDTFNGNVVFVPAEVERRIGRISDRFTHATGDTEYGLRARTAGIDVSLLPDHVGTCRRNPPPDHTLRSFLGPKGLPWRDWLYVTRRYTRCRLWPLAFVGPYLRTACPRAWIPRSRVHKPESAQVPNALSPVGECSRTFSTTWTLVHVLGPLHRSGAEIALLSAADIFRSAGAQQVTISLASAHESSIAHRFEDAGLAVHHIGGDGSWVTMRRYIRLLNKLRPSVVHVHAEHASALTTTLPRIFRARVIRTVRHTFEFEGILRYRKMVERAVSRAAGVMHVSISPSVRANERLRFRNQSRQISNWFDDDRFVPPTAEERASARERLDLPPTRCVIAVVGNCSEVKNHVLLLEAMAALAPSDRPILLHAGTGEAECVERQKAEELGIQPDVRFLGAVDDTARLLHAADAFFFPSLYEGLGVAALEAAGTGLPLVVADSAGLRDLAALGAEVQVLPLDVSSFSEALKKIRLRPADSPHRETIAQTCRTLFGMKRGVEMYLDQYGLDSSSALVT